MGKDLADDPEYQQRLSAGLSDAPKAAATGPATWQARLSVGLFLVGVVLVVLLGTFPELRTWHDGPEPRVLGMAQAIEMLMLSIAALMAMTCRASVEKMANGSVFRAGVQAVIAIFGIAWMGDTFFKNNLDQIQGPLQALVTQRPWLFAVALFVMSILLYSQAATVRSLMPLGVSLGLPASALTGMFPAVNGYFFIPNYPTLVAAINFDRTGTTRIGKWVLNHSFMLPGLAATAGSVAAGLILGRLVM
jgi:anaerobic C4-dicarboxylate transporter DcuA